MHLKEITRLELPATADMHVHLRQDKLMELVTPYIRHGGVDTVFVMVSWMHTSIQIGCLLTIECSQTFSLLLLLCLRLWSIRLSCKLLSLRLLILCRFI